jgi:predicted dehydrogenase
MRVLVVGSGPAGRRHVEVVRTLGHEAAVARRASQPVDVLGGELGVPVFAGLDAAREWGPEAVIVATVPSAHAEAAEWGLRSALPVLVEKPLADDAATARALAERAGGGRLVVGYNLRFHPAMRAIEAAVRGGRLGALLAVRAEVGSHLPLWHDELDYRVGSAARKELGGGALLTLSHELDLVLWIGGPAALAAGARARVSDLELDVEDVAEVVLRHESGALSSVHVDLIDRAYNRQSRWIGSAGTITWAWGGPARLLGGDGETVLWDDEHFDLVRTYVDEVAAFLAGEAPPGDHLGDAVRALELIEAVDGS